MPEFDTADDFGGFEVLARGQYHVVVLDVAENPTKGGKLIDGTDIEFQVLDGTVRANGRCSEVGKKVGELLFNPQETNKDGGKFLRQKITNFLIAAGLVQHDARGKKVSFEWSDAKGRQLVVFTTTKKRKYTKDGEEREIEDSEIEGVNFYHITDPKVAHVPKDVKALALMGLALDASAKVIPKATSTTKPPANANGGNGAAAPAKQPVAAAAGELDLSDL